MAQDYTRQSSFSDGDTITASLFNDEYNQLVNAFAYSSTDATSTGHRHDGTAAQGGNIPKIGDLDFKNKIEVDSTNNRWGFYVEVSSAAVEQIRIQDGAIVPVTDNDIDLGSSSLEFKNLYIDGTATIDDLTVDASAVIGTTLLVGGASSFQGDVTLGNATADTLVVNALVNSNFVPEADSTWNLGSTSLYWANAYIDAITTTGNVTVGGAFTSLGINDDATTTKLTLTNASTTVGNTLRPASIVFDGATGISWEETISDILYDRYAIEYGGNRLTISYNNSGIAQFQSDGTFDLENDLIVGGNLTVTGNATISGNLTFGDADTDSITLTADVASHITPDVDDTYDLGSSTKEWRNLYIDGTANIDSLVADTADINAGTIDNTVIGGTTPAAGTFTTFTSTGIDDNATGERLTITDSGIAIGNTGTNPTPVNGTTVVHATASSGAEFIAGTNDTVISSGAFMGGYIFKNADSTGSPPHYSGMWAESADTSGNMNLYFAAGSTGYETGSADLTIDSSGNTTVNGFTSNGIDDNATSTQITLTNTSTTINNNLKPSSITFTSSAGISWEEIISDVLYDRYSIEYGNTHLFFKYDGAEIARFKNGADFTLENNFTVGGNATVNGTFTSTGIDDNATATRLTVNNGFTEFDATNHYVKFNGSTDSLRIGTTSTGYAYFINDGPSAGTGNSGIAFYDNGSVELWSPAGDAITGNLRIDSSGNTTVNGFTSTGIDDNATANVVTIAGGSSGSNSVIQTLNSGSNSGFYGSSTSFGFEIGDGGVGGKTVRINNNGTAIFSHNQVQDVIDMSNASSVTVAGFTSTGIDDNATETAITIDANENVEIEKQYADLLFNGEAGQGRITTGSGAAGGFTVDNVYGGSGVNFKNSGAVELFSSNNDAVAGSLTIDTSGRVGIGASPARAFHVTDSAQNIARFESTSTGRGVISILDANTTDDTSVGIGAVANDLVLYSGNLSEGFRLDSSGNVGIGLGGSAASATLDLNGTFRLNGNSTATGHNLFIGDAAGEDLTTGLRNTAVGSVAMRQLTTANECTALGYGALNATTTGINNTAVGRSAIQANTIGRDNTGVGYLALFNNTTGDYNVAVGSDCLSENTTGAYNVGMGYQALEQNTTGTVSVGIGFRALEANTTGNSNTAVGYEALKLNTTGVLNTAFGRESLEDNTTGSYNSGFGTYSLYDNISGESNTAVGYAAVQSNTTASYNVGVGYQALLTNTTGANNTAVGTFAIKSNNTGSNNTAVGYATLWGVGDGEGNTAVGSSALFANTSGDDNTAVGSGALGANTTGIYNTASGYQALYSATTATHNVAVGYAAGYALTTGSQCTLVGNYAGLNTTSAQHTAMGYSALQGNTTGSAQVAVGYQALQTNTTGNYNTALGYQAGQTLNANYNTLVGYVAGKNTTSSGLQTAVGYASLFQNTTGSSHTAIGYASLYSNTTGSYNCAVGTEAMRYNTTGTQCTTLGNGSLLYGTTGSYNVAIGNNAMSGTLTDPNTGSYNTAVGTQAMRFNKSGLQNTSVGYYALRANTSGRDNTAVGQGAMLLNTAGDYNTACGSLALEDCTTGLRNAAVGYGALRNITTGERNVGQGHAAGSGITTGNYNTFVGYATGGTITSGTGNVHVGYAHAGSSASVTYETIVGYSLAGKGTNTAYIGGTNGAYNQANSSTWSTTSDRRIKKNIQDNGDGLEKINALRVRNFEYRSADEIDELDGSCAIDKSGTQIGVIAQEIMEVLPDTVTQESTGCYSVNPDNLTWYLVNAVKELSAKVDALENQLNGA